MKKLLMSLALVGTFAAMSAKGDSYLYWMVENASDGTGPLAFDAAEIYAINSNRSVQDFLGASLAVAGTEDGAYSTERNMAGGLETKALNYDISNYANEGWSFLVELYQDNKWVSESVLSYQEVAAMGGIYKSLNPSGAGAKFTSFNVPEPTSGLLMLIGLCGLALKRKRA